MSNIFKDPIYEKMKTDEDQWLTLAVQPFEFSLIEFFDSLPETVVLNHGDSASLIQESIYGYRTNEIRVSLSVMESVLAAVFSKTTLHRSFIHFLFSKEIFTLKVEGDTIDLKRKIYPKFSVIKSGSLSEQDYISFIASESSRLSLRNDIKSLNEIVELLGCPAEARKSTSGRKKEYAVKRQLEKIISNNEWNIKNGDLMLSISRWIADYVNNGNMQAISLLSRLKCMTYNKEPIYSMHGVK